MDGSRILFVVAAFVVLIHAWRGWRAGVVRQVVSLVALVVAGAAAFFGRELLVPVLRPLGLPERQLSFVAGAVLGVVIYFAILIFSAIVFKKTSQQDVGLVRLGYGFFGALIGALRGLVIVWIIFVVLRLFGVIAEVRVEMARHPHGAHRPPGTAVNALAGVKSALDDGPLGAVLDRLDPFPSTLHRVIPKLVRVFNDEETAKRLRDYPGMQTLLNHPKLAELGRDPEVERAVEDKNYLALLRNDRVQAALSDSAFTATLLKFDLEKALDYALGSGEKPTATPSRR